MSWLLRSGWRTPIGNSSVASNNQCRHNGAGQSHCVPHRCPTVLQSTRGARAHARQMKRARREQKPLHTPLGRVMRDVARKIDVASQTNAVEGERLQRQFARLMDISGRIHAQKRVRAYRAAFDLDASLLAKLRASTALVHDRYRLTRQQAIALARKRLSQGRRINDQSGNRLSRSSEAQARAAPPAASTLHAV